MSMYALAIMPLINELKKDSLCQIWYADDSAASGSLSDVREWWNKLNTIGPRYGYYPNSKKTWLLVKGERCQEAEKMFQQSGVNITNSGRKYLGAALGNPEFVHEYVEQKVKEWTGELEALSSIGRRDPHAAYSAFTHGLVGKWQYILRTVPSLSKQLIPLEDAIRCKFIPVITGQNHILDVERDLLALPCRLGGMGLINPTKICDDHFSHSEEITGPLVNLIIQQKLDIPEDLDLLMRQKKTTLRQNRRKKWETDAANLNLNDKLKRSVEFAKEKGASIWLTSLPLERYGFALHRSAFKDAISLRYGWLPDNLPLKCACDVPFSVDHALSCPKGAFPTHRHNELRDITAGFLSEVCEDVTTEPILQPTEGVALKIRYSKQ